MRYLGLFFLLCLVGCADDDDVMVPEPGPLDGVAGIGYVSTAGADLDSTYSRLTAALNANAAIQVVAEVDHAAAAARAGQSLPPTRLVIFGNPELGTPLLEINPLAGLDLPQKMLVYEEGSAVVAAYNTNGYLVQRHNVGAAGSLINIGSALGNLVATAVGANDVVIRITTATNTAGEGIVTEVGAGTVDSVYARLRTAVANNGNLSIIAEVDHAANAASVGTDIPPNRLLVFGNPALGTELMQAERSVALDLPQKLLVYESATGEVTVAYNDPDYLARRHGIDQQLPVLTTIADALAALAAAAF